VDEETKDTGAEEEVEGHVLDTSYLDTSKTDEPEDEGDDVEAHKLEPEN
jgi:hypothetical protein